MLHKERPRIFFFSGWSYEFIRMLKAKNIMIEDVLDGVHPFATVGTQYAQMDKWLEGCDNLIRIVSIKKNFKNMLSRNEATYESNHALTSEGKAVRYKNETDYLIINFICCANQLYRFNGNMYSYIWANKEFTDFISKGEKIPVPFPVDFNWKYYAKLFADACTENYDSDHIILIRVNTYGYYCQNHNVNTTCSMTRELGEQIRAIEDDFIARTHCHCIDGLLNHSPKDDRVFIPYPKAVEEVADEVAEIIYGGEDKKHKDLIYSQPVIRFLCKKLTDTKFDLFKRYFDEYDGLVCTEAKKKILNNESTDIFASLKYLRRFIDDENRYSLFDYVKECLEGENIKIDIRLLELYTEYFRLEISDIVAVYLTYNATDDKKNLKEVVQNICTNYNNSPLKYIKKIIKKNQKYLKDYEYIDGELLNCLNFDIDEGMMFYPIRISESGYLIFNPNGIDDLIISETWENKSPNVDDIINAGMVCKPEYIEELSRDWGFYVKRAQKQKGNEPLRIVFKNEIEFQHSLVFLDYKDILESENAILVFEKNKSTINTDGYVSKCNLESLFDDNTKIFDIKNGLADQIQYYLQSKYAEEKTGANIIYDDLSLELEPMHNGVEIDKILQEDSGAFESKRLSRMLSPRLMKNLDANKNIADLLFEKGWNDIVGVTWGNQVNPVKVCSRFILSGFSTLDFAICSGIKYYSGMETPGAFWGDRLDFDKYFAFPEFTDSRNMELEKIMLSCDAIVLHFRLGDMLRLIGKAPDTSFFFKCLMSLQKIEQYSKKRFFVFSDDIKWCEQHESDIFGSVARREDVFYISHNKGENAYLDMKLMSLGKVIIASNSGFSFYSAVLSKTREIYISNTPFRNWHFNLLGLKNKYELV